MIWWNTQPHSGEYGSQTVIPPGWPNVDEEYLAQAATEFELFRDHLRTSVIPNLRAQLMALADEWDGDGSEAARNEASGIIDEHETNANLAGDVAAKLRNMESSVVKTKIAANGSADAAQNDCEANNKAGFEPGTAAVLNEARIATGFADNVQLVAANAVELGSNIGVPPGARGANGKMSGDEASTERPRSEERGLAHENLPPPSGPSHLRAFHHSGAGGGPDARGGFAGEQSPPSSTAPTAAPPVLAEPSQAAVAPNNPGSIGGGSSAGGGSSSGLSSSGGGSSSGSPIGSTPSPAGAGSGAGSGSPGAGGQTSVSAAGPGADKAAVGRSPAGGMTPALSPPLGAPAPASQPTPSPAPAQPSATAAGSSAPTSPGLPGTSAGGFGGAAAVPAGGAPAVGPSPMPLGPPTTPAPAAPVNPGATPAAGPYSPGVAPASTQASSAAGVPAAVPVSATRAERDAAVAAATAGALRRRNQGNDPAQLARRIAAALNVGNCDFGFYWVTALTVEGTIAVANSYGIGYIPANVFLPEGVQMVTADESIVAEVRADWATYPILALQGWAQHHNERLRVVIATKEQFQGFDPGTAKVILQLEDIPDSGTMRGLNRLEVIAPEAAAKLAATSDDSLVNLLPPAQTDVHPPQSDLAMLWFEVSKPLMSSSTGRAEAHLFAFRVYADHAMALALYMSHTEPEIQAQRTAIADWVYWQHQRSLIAEALRSGALRSAELGSAPLS